MNFVDQEWRELTQQRVSNEAVFCLLQKIYKKNLSVGQIHKSNPIIQMWQNI